MEPDAPLGYEADPEGVPVCSSLDWETVTTPGTTLVGVAIVERAAWVGLQVPGGTYSGHAHHLSL